MTDDELAEIDRREMEAIREVQREYGISPMGLGEAFAVGLIVFVAVLVGWVLR